MSEMNSELLQPHLERAQAALQLALDEACGVDLRQVDTGELIRIEETLAVATEAAKEAVSVRLKLRNERSGSGLGGSPTTVVPAADIPVVATQRVFEDIRGRRWRAFAVRPSAVSLERAALPESFRGGWLSFEASDETRRIAPIPDNWIELSVDELRLLCYRAPIRTKRAADGATLPVEDETPRH